MLNPCSMHKVLPRGLLNSVCPVQIVLIMELVRVQVVLVRLPKLIAQRLEVVLGPGKVPWDVPVGQSAYHLDQCILTAVPQSLKLMKLAEGRSPPSARPEVVTLLWPGCRFCQRRMSAGGCEGITWLTCSAKFDWYCLRPSTTERIQASASGCSGLSSLSSSSWSATRRYHILWRQIS